MALAVDRIDHVEVFVRDPDAAARWYTEVLGLREVGRWDPEPIMVGVGDTKLALFRADPNAGGTPHEESVTTPGWHRVAWQTNAEGFQLFQKHLANSGIRFRGPVNHGIARSIYFRDPDGNPLEITYYV